MARIRYAVMTLVAAATVCVAGQGPPRTLLHIPFDGTADAGYCAFAGAGTCYVDVSFKPGKKGQAAEVGSDRHPCGLSIQAPRVLDTRRGSLALWYQPLWDPGDRAEQGVTRTIATDARESNDVGHFWLTLARNAIHAAWRGRRAEGVSAPLSKWTKGSWHHIVLTWDEDKGLSLYVDGQLGGTRELRWRLPGSDVLYLGANRRGLNRAGGLLDEFYLYDRALTPAEVELAFVQNLQSPRAPSVGRGAQAAAQPKVTLHLPFDGSAAAKVAAGAGKPAVAEKLEFTNGLIGRALVCGQGIDLAYEAGKNLSKDAGAITFWARSSFGSQAPRGLLLADEQAPAKEGEKARNTLGVWLQRAGIASLNFDMLPASLQRVLFRWDSADWHHFALCWRRGDELALYVNGRLASRRTGAGVRWAETPSTLLRVGSWKGEMAAEAVIDDLRVYDRPLAASQILAEANQYLLPLVVQVRQTLLVRGKASELAVAAHNPSAKPFEGELTVAVANPAGKELAKATEAVKIAVGGKAELRLALSKEALGHEGLYRVTTASPKRVNTPMAYFLVVSELPALAPTDGDAAPQPKLKHVETIDVSKVADAERFCHSGRSKLVDALGAKVREAGPVPNDRFAYKFTVQAPGEPHVVVVKYPDEGRRSAEIVINSKGAPNALDVATGYITTANATGKQAELPLYFWPREADNAIIFRTLIGGQPASCTSISIFQLTEGLPPTRADVPADGGRSIGLWWRQPAAPVKFGARTVLAPDIYRSFDRLADYLRFAGHDLLCYPVAWDAGVLYPSAGEGFRMGAGADRHCTDWVQYALYVCEQRGLRFLPQMFVNDLFALSDRFGSDEAADLAAGKASGRLVTWDGTLSRGGPQEPPLYTPVHAVVRDAILERIDELGRRYSRSPALAGVALHLGQSHCLWFGSILSGYGDATVAQFEKDTGIRVAVRARGAARFAARARWLLGQKRAEWVAWRCKVVHALLAEAATRLRKHRGGLTLYVDVGVPDAFALHPLAGLGGWIEGRRSLGESYREGGLDLSLFAKTPGIVVRRVLSPSDGPILAYQGGGGVAAAAVDSLQRLREANAPFLAAGQAGAVCSYRSFESSIGRLAPMKGFWWGSPAARPSYPTAAGRQFLEPLARAVADLDAVTLAVGGAAVLTAGHEPELRAFTRAFRALPRKRFADVPGMSDPVCARELRDGDAHLIYLVNRAPYPVRAYLAFEPRQVALRDLATGAKATLEAVTARELPAPATGGTQRVSGALLDVTLEPFELRSYRVLMTKAQIIHAAAEVSPGARLRLAQRRESVKTLVKQSRETPEAIAAATKTLALIEEAWAKGEVVRVGHLLDSHTIERLR